MKVLFIESRLKNSYIDIPESEIIKLPKKIILAYTIQYKEIAEKVKSLLLKNKIKIIKFIQVLGCSRVNIKFPVLFIGSGTFHSNNLIFQASEVYELKENRILKVPDSTISKLKNRKTALLKFLSAENIGILVSTKSGQENLKPAEKLKEILIKKGKNPYIFIANNLDLSQFENFQIDSWINTACPGLINDDPRIINISEISLN